MLKSSFRILLVSILLSSCNGSGEKNQIIIFHAGSLSVPFRELADLYMQDNPGVNILLEPAGSLVCARKITELKKPCDIMASADYIVIDQLLIPDYTKWGIRFATNEIVIAFTDKAKYSGEIDSINWKEILLRDDVTYCRSDPNSDPCGYRTVMTLKLAEKKFNLPGLTERFLVKDQEFIRPKEVDLIALIEANAVDYMFQYKSVAIQHNIKYIELPDDINLGNPLFNDLYSQISVDVTGSSPGSKFNIKGEYVNYSLTVIDSAMNMEGAIDFVSFLLSDKGMEVFRKNGQNPIIPFTSNDDALIPEKLKIHLPKK